MKKLLLDLCAKTAFSFDNVLYEQCDGVSMGTVLANITLTEFENVIVKSYDWCSKVLLWIRKRHSCNDQER